MSEAKTPTDPEQQPDDLRGLPSYLLTRISHRYMKAIRTELKSVKLNTIATRVIAALRVFPGLTVNDLCSHTISEQPTMSHALDRLETDGLIFRKVHEDDSRIRQVYLTDKGHQMSEKVWPVILGMNNKMMQGISEEDRKTTLRTLSKMFDNVDQAR
ncbi:MarR family winged helix-turn-helix transcriptional regulator [uncultured Shimia sp.]|uniref:MarR family winged helix-turn-helix transcriptional regulator n=1 Tax=uncultured Shimia sp. TaxID=573152 RepID=UPI0026261A6D|nr:MarR family winged helix-turn-helix transcriptional regulator [uncultured Shimia sp.]